MNKFLQVMLRKFPPLNYGAIFFMPHHTDEVYPIPLLGDALKQGDEDSILFFKTRIIPSFEKENTFCLLVSSRKVMMEVLYQFSTTRIILV